MFYATFEDLFLNHSILIDDEELKRYSKAWKKPAVSKDLAKYDATEDGEDRNAENVRILYRPRGAQIEALYALQESRMEGAAKGLVYAATGIGKTYLAAFDSAKYERVLFVAHREEILKQAAVSFKNVRNSADYGFFVEKDGYALALRDEIGEVVGNMAFGEQMGDVLGYRSLEYYRRRYEKK